MNLGQFGYHFSLALIIPPPPPPRPPYAQNSLKLTQIDQPISRLQHILKCLLQKMKIKFFLLWPVCWTERFWCFIYDVKYTKHGKA